MSDSKLAPVTMSMIWTHLLFTVQQHTETSPAVERARDRIIEAGDDQDGPFTVHAHEILEELAREQFPSGMINGFGWQFYPNGAPHPFWDVFRSPYEDEGEDDPDPETFCEVCEILHEPLSPTDPAHVAMVARALALSFSMPCGVEPVGVLVKLDRDPETERNGVLVSVENFRGRYRPHPSGVPFSAGHFIPDLGAQTVDYGDAVFRWFLNRHAEIAAVLDLSKLATT